MPTARSESQSNCEFAILRELKAILSLRLQRDLHHQRTESTTQGRNSRILGSSPDDSETVRRAYPIADSASLALNSGVPAVSQRLTWVVASRMVNRLPQSITRQMEATVGGIEAYDDGWVVLELRFRSSRQFRDIQWKSLRP
jgi:hypothetical protein